MQNLAVILLQIVSETSAPSLISHISYFLARGVFSSRKARRNTMWLLLPPLFLLFVVRKTSAQPEQPRITMPVCSSSGLPIWPGPDPNNPGPFPIEICEEGEEPSCYKRTYTSMEEIDNLITQYVDLGDWPDFLPETVVVTGGSRGIGNAIACYFASLDASKVISLSSSPPDPTHRCAGVDFIELDLEKNENHKWGQVLESLGSRSVDLLLLNAGRDGVGSLKDTTEGDFEKILRSNVLGNHNVWQRLHGRLREDFSVVLAVSSTAAEEPRFFFKRASYALTKQLLKNLVLSYAVEDEFFHPRTYYGVVLQGDAKTSFGLKAHIPLVNYKDQECRNDFLAYGAFANRYLQTYGMELAEGPGTVTEWYHKIFGLFGLIDTANTQTPGTVLRSMIPQTFSVAQDTSIDEQFLDTSIYNNRYFRPEATNFCYSVATWSPLYEYFSNSCPFFPCGEDQCCEGFEFIANFLDPRVESCPASDLAAPLEAPRGQSKPRRKKAKKAPAKKAAKKKATGGTKKKKTKAKKNGDKVRPKCRGEGRPCNGKKATCCNSRCVGPRGMKICRD